MQKTYRTKVALGFLLVTSVLVILLAPVEPTSELELPNDVEESAHILPTKGTASRLGRTTSSIANQPESAQFPAVEVEKEFALKYSMVQEGLLASFVDAVFSPSNLASIREAFGDRLRFRNDSRVQIAEDSANQFFESHYEPLLMDLNLSSEKARLTRSVIVDDTRRRSELVTLWTDREISFDEYRERSDRLPDVETRLTAVLSQSELSGLNSGLAAAVKDSEFSPEFLSSYEESRSGSLYPLVQRDDIEALVAYLDAGANPNEVRKGDADISPLSLAVSVGSKEAVATLIEHGADINFTHADGDSLLHRAATQGAVSITEQLLVSGADPTVRNQIGLTPRMTAIVAGLRHTGDAHTSVQRLVESAEEIN